MGSMVEPLYVSHARASDWRGRVVRVLVRPSPKRRPNNVLVEDVDTGKRSVTPWRTLRRLKG